MQQEIRERIDMIRRGDIPLGYKKTSVGVIPDNWNVKKIGDISKINLLSLSSDTANDYEFYYYDLSSIDEGKINHPNIKTKYSESPSRARRIFRRNDILMSTVRPNLKGFAKIDFDAEDCVSSTGFAVITVNDEDDFDFLYHNLFSYNIEQQINSLLVGSNYPAINNEDVENLCIPYISIKSEQQKIAAILSTWDKAIELKEKLIAQKQVQKKGLAQNLLTGKIRVNEIGSINHEQLKQRLFLIHNGEVPEGYQKTKLGILPLDWKVEKAKSIFKNVSIKNNGENEELLSVTQDRGVLPRRLLGQRVMMPEGDTDSFKLVQPNQYIISLRSFEGGIELSNYRGIVSPAYTVIENIKEISHIFYKHLFKTVDFIKRMNSAVIGIRDGKQISYSDFSELYIQYPDKDEQREIAKIITLADQELQLLQQELTLLKQQKKGLMQLLLTGVVRVKY